MAWTVPSHYLNQCWNIVNWTLRNKLQWKFNRNSNIFIHENAIESVVCEMASILSQPQCVNGCVITHPCWKLIHVSKRVPRTHLNLTFEWIRRDISESKIKCNIFWTSMSKIIFLKASGWIIIPILEGFYRYQQNCSFAFGCQSYMIMTKYMAFFVSFNMLKLST